MQNCTSSSSSCPSWKSSEVKSERESRMPCPKLVAEEDVDVSSVWERFSRNELNCFGPLNIGDFNI
jgi:hypothetical protein